MPAAALADSLRHPSRRAPGVAHLGVVRPTRPPPLSHALRKRSLVVHRFRSIASFRLPHVSVLQPSMGSRLHVLDRDASLGSSSLHGFTLGAPWLSLTSARPCNARFLACSWARRIANRAA